LRIQYKNYIPIKKWGNREEKRMSIKKKLGMGVASAALGLSLVGGGTYAYFNDVETLADNDMIAGTLDLKPEMENQTLFEVQDLKPGDTMTRFFDLTNGGSLNIARVMFEADVVGVTEGTPAGITGGTGAGDLADHLYVTIFDRDNNAIAGLTNITLNELENAPATEISGNGIPKGDTDRMKVQIKFVDNLQNQNHLQGDSAQLSLSFTAEQEAGKEVSNNVGDSTGDGITNE
jgi:spore coat-associated protein N